MKCFQSSANQDIADNNFYYYEEVNTSPFSQTLPLNPITYQNLDASFLNNETVYTEIETGEWNNLNSRPSSTGPVLAYGQTLNIDEESLSVSYAMVQKR